MKLKILLISLIIIWGTGCVAYIQHPTDAQIRIVRTRAVVTITNVPRVVRHVHVHRPHRVTRHTHTHRHSRPVVRQGRHHHDRASNHRDQRRRRARSHRTHRRSPRH
jgi:hypothetical protein